MLVMKGIFEDREEWMIATFDNMFIPAHDYKAAYNKLKQVQDKAHKR